MSETSNPITIKSTAKKTYPVKILNSENNNLLAAFLEGRSGNGNMVLHNKEGERKVRISSVYHSFINSEGNFGIGTKTPKETLDVVGTIQCTGLKIQNIQDVGPLPTGFYPLAIEAATGNVVCYVPA